MSILSTEESPNATKKRCKIHRSRPAIARKIIAFQELTNLKQKKKSAREAADILEVPNSTMQSWREQQASNRENECAKFFSSPCGADFLAKNVMAVMKLMKCGPSGIQGMQEYLKNSGLDQFVASSEGALQKFWVRCEEFTIEFANCEEKRLTERMKHRKITAVLDEMFRVKRPCLVAIEAVSNYILLEKFTEDRTADTWKKEIEPRLKELNIEVSQVVSDLCGAIRAVAKNLGAKHISELFHAQYEISKATAAPLASQERAAKKALDDAEEKVRKISEKPRKIGKGEEKKQLLDMRQAVNDQEKRRIEFEEKKRRRESVKAAVKEMGKIHHPIDIKTGKLQTAEEIENGFNKQFEIIQECAENAKLSESSIGRIEKAKRAFDAIVCYVKYFFIVYAAFIEELGLGIEQGKFFNNIIFPLCYLKMIWRRIPRESRIEIKRLMMDLEAKIREGPWPEEVKDEWMIRGKELAEIFQRSSSCVEGRNSVISLNHHRFHRLNARSLKVLTIIHNFDVRRSDGTTAAERFFGAKHENLFEALVANVRIPGKPKQQYHDMQKRQSGWEKRRVA
jgi:Family of unknown function (DUF6399)